MIESRNKEIIAEVINSFTRDNEILLDQLMQISYYFRGAISRDDAWMMSTLEREAAIEFINKKFKDAQPMMKAGLSVFL